MTRCCGYSFVELLLAVLIFSLGITAVAAMQFGSVQATRSSSEAAAALLLVEDLAQRLLLSPDAIDRHTLPSGDAVAVSGQGEVGAGCSSVLPCAIGAWGQWDVDAWLALSEGRGLTAPLACVTRRAAALTVSLGWVTPAADPSRPQGSCVVTGDEPGRRWVSLQVPLEVLP